MLGLAIGDALGAPVEFMQRGTFTPVKDFAPTPRWGLDAGVWTDDTIMAVCLADSLIAARGYDSWAAMDEYDAWYSKGKHTPHGYCFDIGNQTVMALHRYHTPLPYITQGERRSEAAGNGSVMRLAPAAIVAARVEAERGDRLLSYSARETHYSHEAEEATVIYGRMMGAALRGEQDKYKILQAALGAPDQYDLLGMLAQTSPQTPVSGAGYVRLSVQAAWWAFISTDTFEACVLEAVNLGDDADTTGAIAGQLAGAYYGLAGIPDHWRANVWKRSMLEDLADQLASVPCHVVRTRFEEDDEFARR